MATLTKIAQYVGLSVLSTLWTVPVALHGATIYNEALTGKAPAAGSDKSSDATAAATVSDSAKPPKPASDASGLLKGFLPYGRRDLSGTCTSSVGCPGTPTEDVSEPTAKRARGFAGGGGGFDAASARGTIRPGSTEITQDVAPAPSAGSDSPFNPWDAVAVADGRVALASMTGTRQSYLYALFSAGNPLGNGSVTYGYIGGVGASDGSFVSASADRGLVSQSYAANWSPWSQIWAESGWNVNWTPYSWSDSSQSQVVLNDAGLPVSPGLSYPRGAVNNEPSTFGSGVWFGSGGSFGSGGGSWPGAGSNGSGAGSGGGSSSGSGGAGAPVVFNPIVPLPVSNPGPPLILPPAPIPFAPNGGGAATPEPGTWALTGLGLVGAALRASRWRGPRLLAGRSRS